MRIPVVLVAFVITLLSCYRVTERLTQYEVHGIDVSHYQARIDWDTVATQQIHFAYLKASEGATYQDSLFLQNWAAAARVGIKRGAYHFFRPTVPAWIQSKNFREQVELLPGDLPPVLDVEVLDGVDAAELVSGVRNWLYSVETHIGVKPIIYTNQKFYRQYLAHEFADYPVWIARYHNEAPKVGANVEWQFWQYGNRGRVRGIEGDVDLNVFRGNLLELEALSYDPVALVSDL